MAATSSQRPDPFVTISLAGPPRGKGRPRFVMATGRTYTDAKSAGYEAALRAAAVEAMRGRAALEVAVKVRITAHFAVPASYTRRVRMAALTGEMRPTVKPDADNILKFTDALNGIVWIDDKQVVFAAVSKVYSEFPGLVIDVWPQDDLVQQAAAAPAPLI